jgi:hypothetical protein
MMASEDRIFRGCSQRFGAEVQNTRFENASVDKGRRVCVGPHSENPGVAKQKHPFALCSAKLQKDEGLGQTRRDLQKDIHAGHKCLTKSID